MINNDNANVHLIASLFLSLFISSLLISWFLLQIYGIGVVNTISPLTMDNKIFNSTQNFKTDEIDNTILIQQDSDWTYQDGIGRVLTSKRGFATGKLFIDKVKPDSNGIITNYYHINNSVHSFYSIILKRVPTDLTGVNVELYFNTWGINLAQYLIDIQWHNTVKVFYPDIQNVDYADIKTVYSIYEGKCDITFNGQTYTITDIPIPSNLDNTVNEGFFGEYFAGVSSDTYGFTLEDFNTDNTIENNVSLFNQATAILTLMAKILVWNVDSKYLPIELNLLLIKTQLSALIIAILGFIIGRD